MTEWLSRILIPLAVGSMVGFGLLEKRPVFEDFLDGAKEGLRTAAELIPTLTGLLAAVGVWRASGLLEILGGLLEGPASWLHLPAELIPLCLVRLVSHSSALGLLLDIFRQYGPDSYLGMAASVMMSSTETVFYCVSVYCGAAHVNRTRYLLPGALLATAAGIAASLLFVRAFFS